MRDFTFHLGINMRALCGCESPGSGIWFVKTIAAATCVPCLNEAERRVFGLLGPLGRGQLGVTEGFDSVAAIRQRIVELEREASAPKPTINESFFRVRGEGPFAPSPIPPEPPKPAPRVHLAASAGVNEWQAWCPAAPAVGVAFRLSGMAASATCLECINRALDHAVRNNDSETAFALMNRRRELPNSAERRKARREQTAKAAEPHIRTDSGPPLCGEADRKAPTCGVHLSVDGGRPGFGLCGTVLLRQDDFIGGIATATCVPCLNAAARSSSWPCREVCARLYELAEQGENAGRRTTVTRPHLALPKRTRERMLRCALGWFPDSRDVNVNPDAQRLAADVLHLLDEVERLAIDLAAEKIDRRYVSYKQAYDELMERMRGV